jgi:tetratricopeptide (TPR) repeat protein
MNGALEAFKKVLKIHHGHRDAHFYLGMVYYHKGLYGRALKHFQHVLDQDGDNAAILYHIGVSYNHMDQPKKAIPLLRKVTEINPEDGKAYFYLGVAYDKAGLIEQAKESYRIADLKFQKSESHGGTL